MTPHRSDKNQPSHAEEREECFQALAEHPADLNARLRLARLFYEDGLHEFAVRELIELRRRAEVMPPSLERLLAAFGEIARPYLDAVATGNFNTETAAPSDTDPSTADTVAELDVDAEFADLLVDLEDE